MILVGTKTVVTGQTYAAAAGAVAYMLLEGCRVIWKPCYGDSSRWQGGSQCGTAWNCMVPAGDQWLRALLGHQVVHRL